MAELADDLGRFLEGEPVLATRPGPLSRIVKRVRRRKAATAAVAATALALVLGAAIALFVLTERAKERGEWVLVFEDDFEREELGPDWLAWRGTWEIHDGALCCQSRIDSISVMLDREYPGDVRVEYDAWAEEWPVCDLSCFINSIKGYSASGGYFLGFGANRNIRSFVTRRGHLISNHPTAWVRRGQRHHVVAERLGFTVRMTVDGEEINRFDDFFPLSGPDHCEVGLYSWCSHPHFDNIRVYVRKGAKKLTRTAAADLLFEEGAYARAAQEFRAAADDLSGREAGIARFKEGLALLKAGEREGGERRLRSILDATEDPLISAYAASALAESEFMHGSADRGLEILREAGVGDPKDPRTRIMVFSAWNLARRLQRTGEVRRAHPIFLWALREYGGRLIPSERGIAAVDNALVRQGREAEARKLADELARRIESNPLKRVYFLEFLAYCRMYRHPEETLKILREVDRALKSEGWGGIEEARPPSVATVLAINGCFEEMRTRFPPYRYIENLMRGDRKGAIEEILEILPLESVRQFGQETYLLFALLCLCETDLARPRIEQLIREQKVSGTGSVWEILSFLEKLVSGEVSRAREFIDELTILPEGSYGNPLLYHLQRKAAPEEFREDWMWGWLGYQLLIQGEAPWGLDLANGLRSELEGNREKAGEHYRAAAKAIRWKIPEWYFVQNAIKRVEGK
jgi:hypothetical protein